MDNELNRRHVNPTWSGVKQVGWAVLAIYPFIAVFAIGASRLVGNRAATWIGIGLALLTAVTFGLIVGASLVVSHGHDLLEWVRRRRSRVDGRPPGT
jgi:hypothetical protein